MNPTEPIVSEILLQHGKKILMARVLTRFDVPRHRYPKSGVWSYLIPTPSGIVIFDAGPYYRSPLGLRGRKTHNTERIFRALDMYFPEKPVTEILISHYHFDHLQNASDLQSAAEKRFGIKPPIRLHGKDLERKRLVKIFPTNARRIAQKNGHRDVLFGAPVKDNEPIIGTNFITVHAPGHTSGNIALVNHKERVVIAGWWAQNYPSKIARITTRVIDEDPKKMPETIKKLTLPGYTYFYYHKWEPKQKK
jgi:glyoxylase-like metal-dependent hydrolase (beta-lactamase superfamily II)